MITVNVLSRVFEILYNDSTGTCFIIEVDNKQYFVTAKHVIEGAKSGDSIEFAHKTGWLARPIWLTGHSPNTDISVFSVPYFTFKRHPLPIARDGLVYGQDAYFLGFPYGLSYELGEANNDFPASIVKKAIISNLPTKSDDLLLLDGLNNPGFSGGPVVIKKHNGDGVFNVAGVISGYKFDTENATLKNSPTALEYRTNSGIIIAYTIVSALELIKQNPNGMLIP